MYVRMYLYIYMYVCMYVSGKDHTSQLMLLAVIGKRRISSGKSVRFILALIFRIPFWNSVQPGFTGATRGTTWSPSALKP